MANKSKPNKPFKTYNQQLKILRERGLIIENGSNAISVLKRHNYYEVINGYKDLFLQEKGTDEKYFSGTKFEHINALREFDKEIRHLFLYHILTFENIIKTKISYYHTEKFNEIFNYLDINNFEGDIKDITSLIAKISNGIQQNTQKTSENNFSHYIKRHGELPLWVLFQRLNFGASSYFYASLHEDLKIKICNELNIEHKKRYKLKEFNVINPLFLKNTVHFINSYRNICAHNERMFLASIHKKEFKVDYSKYTTSQFRGTPFDLLLILKLFLLKLEFKRLVKDFKEHLSILEKKLSDNIQAFNKIKYSSLKLPNDWETIIEAVWEN